MQSGPTVRTAAQNDQIRDGQLKIIHQPMAAQNGGYARGLGGTVRDSAESVDTLI
jgi:hypothetical protein